MTVQSVQKIRRRPERNPENKTAKATQPNLARTPVNTDDSGQAQHAIEGTALCWFTLPALLQPLCTQFGCTVAVACLPAAVNFYIVVSQDVVTVV